jgi:hypothetical protein
LLPLWGNGRIQMLLGAVAISMRREETRSRHSVREDRR